MAMFVSTLVKDSDDCFSKVTVSTETTATHSTTTIVTQNFRREIKYYTVAAGEKSNEETEQTAAELVTYTKVPIEENEETEETEKTEEEEEEEENEENEENEEERGRLSLQGNNTNEEEEEDNTNHATTSSSTTYKVHKFSCQSHKARCNYMHLLNDLIEGDEESNEVSDPFFLGKLYWKKVRKSRAKKK